MNTLSISEARTAGVCYFHQDRPAVWNPGHGEAPLCNECKRKWVDLEQVDISIDLRPKQDRLL